VRLTGIRFRCNGLNPHFTQLSSKPCGAQQISTDFSEIVFLKLISAIAQAELKKSVSCTKASCVHIFTFGLVVFVIIFWMKSFFSWISSMSASQSSSGICFLYERPIDTAFTISIIYCKTNRQVILEFLFVRIKP
jgi:hypothetical protein